MGARSARCAPRVRGCVKKRLFAGRHRFSLSLSLETGRADLPFPSSCARPRLTTPCHSLARSERRAAFPDAPPCRTRNPIDATARANATLGVFAVFRPEPIRGLARRAQKGMRGLRASAEARSTRVSRGGRRPHGAARCGGVIPAASRAWAVFVPPLL